MKHSTIFILLLWVSNLSLAQSKIGLVVFPQISSLSNAEIKEDSVTKNLLTLSGGAGITYTQYLSKKVSIQSGLFYSSQNQKFKSSYHSADVSVEMKGKKRFDYLKIPVLFRYSIQAGEKLNVVPFAGVQLSYLLKYDGGMIVYGENYFDMPATPKGNDFYKKTVFDLPLGINIEYALSKKIELIIGGKIDYALTNAANNNAQYLGASITSYGGISNQKQQAMTYGVNLGMSFSINKKEKRTPTPEPAKAPMLATVKEGNKPTSTHHHIHHKKDTVTLDGKHHHRHHHHHHTALASSNRDHVGEMFNKSYTSLIKGVVYKKGTNEILNNTKIILETEEAKVDSSITAIGGMYTLHVHDRTAKHQMYVYRKGYKPLLISIPDTLLDKHAVSVVKIQLEPDGTDHQDEQVKIVLKGKVLNSEGNGMPGVSITIKNNIDKTTQQITCDMNGRYQLELKKYSHYTVSASKGTCTSEKVNKSTISIKESATLEQDLVISCP
jgi:hypothetical protein